MRKRLTVDQRGRMAEKVMEWGNLVFVGLVISQFISSNPIRISATITGILVFVGAYLGSYRLMTMKGGRK